MQKRLLAIALPALLCAQAASAQELRASLKDSLETAARQMYQKGDFKFIIINAVSDGILKLNEPYDFVYDGQCSFKGKTLSKQQQQEYSDNFRNSMRNANMPEKARVTLSADYVETENLFKTISFKKQEKPSTMTTSAWFTTPPEKRLPENDSAKHIADWLALNMLEDKLIDTTHETVIEYKPGNITVNGKSLSHEQNKKYTAMIDEVNNQSGSHPDTMTFTVFAHPRKLRYPHPGAYTEDK